MLVVFEKSLYPYVRQKGMWRDTIPLSDTETLMRFKPHLFTGRMIFHCHLASHSDRGMMSFSTITGEYTDIEAEPVSTLDYPNCHEIIPEPEDEPATPEPSSGPIDVHYPPVEEQPSKEDKLRKMLPFGISMLLVLMGIAVLAFFLYQHKSEKEVRYAREELESLSSSDSP